MSSSETPGNMSTVTLPVTVLPVYSPITVKSVALKGNSDAILDGKIVEPLIVVVRRSLEYSENNVKADELNGN